MAIITANNQSMTAITALPSGVSAKSMILLATETASSSAPVSFTSNIDDTYKEYQFHFIEMHPATNDTNFTFQTDTGTNTSYNQTMTTTFFQARHTEADTVAALAYTDNRDIAQGTGFQALSYDVGNDADQQCSGTLSLFSPSSTTFVKHFMAETQTAHGANYPQPSYVAGYFNTTSAITGIQFKFNSGNVDAGTIKMYGVV